MDPPLIELDGITRRYAMGGDRRRGPRAPRDDPYAEAEVWALRGVSLTVERGASIAITGASGSGKSSLLDIIGCLERPTAGRYLLDGRDVSALDARARAILRNRTVGFVFRAFHLLPLANAIENVELPLLYAGVCAAERHRRAAEAIEQVGLGRRVYHYPSQLSGGQQQRVAIARALVTEPKLILADEPTGNLDSAAGLDVMALLGQLGRRGVTLLVATHDPEVAAACARTVVMRDGRILSDERRPVPPALPGSPTKPERAR
jgi:putative ABC transport system ATP-binding protein